MGTLPSHIENCWHHSFHSSRKNPASCKASQSRTLIVVRILVILATHVKGICNSGTHISGVLFASSAFSIGSLKDAKHFKHCRATPFNASLWMDFFSQVTPASR